LSVGDAAIKCQLGLFVLPLAGIVIGAQRVLRPGGVFAGSDSIASSGLRDFHHDDVYTPIDPRGLLDRLDAVGFTDIRVDIQPKDEWFSFSALRA
jgi:hypothetical protein